MNTPAPVTPGAAAAASPSNFVTPNTSTKPAPRSAINDYIEQERHDNALRLQRADELRQQALQRREEKAANTIQEAFKKRKAEEAALRAAEVARQAEIDEKIEALRLKKAEELRVKAEEAAHRAALQAAEAEQNADDNTILAPEEITSSAKKTNEITALIVQYWTENPNNTFEKKHILKSNLIKLCKLQKIEVIAKQKTKITINFVLQDGTQLNIGNMLQYYKDNEHLLQPASPSAPAPAPAPVDDAAVVAAQADLTGQGFHSHLIKMGMIHGLKKLKKEAGSKIHRQVLKHLKRYYKL